MKRIALALALCLGAGAPAWAAAAVPAAAPSASQALRRLGDDYWEWAMSRQPIQATFIGHRGYDDRLDDESAAARAAELRAIAELSHRLEAISPAGLSESDRVSWEIMKLELDQRREEQSYKFWQWDVNHMDGPQSWFLTVVKLSQPMATEQDAKNLLARMADYPRYFDVKIANLREGMREGRTAARIGVEKTIAQLQGILAEPADQLAFAIAAKRLPPDLQARYLPQVLAATETGPRKALRRYLEFLQKDYLRSSRPVKVGLGWLPGGAAAYRYAIRRQTTLDESPDALHQIGLQELDSIHAEMKAIAKRMGGSQDLGNFLETVRGDPKNFFSTREEVLAAARAQVLKTYQRLPEFFGRLPKTPLEVRPTEAYKEKNDPAAEYLEPSDDLSRPGIYYINTYEPNTRPRFGMASLAAHEGVPGHHLQIALAIENRSLPEFQRHGEFNAFVEGWALYSERLADEMGLYPDDLSRLGMLSDQALRACRLVVDTGLHAKGWTRRQAIDFMKANTAMSEEEIVAEVDRYIVWPAQALAYKVGQREIAALRRESQARLGPKFDLRAFHDAVLRNGPIPLPTLRRIILGS